MQAVAQRFKFDVFKSKTLFPLLREADQSLVRGVALKYHLSFQELKILCEIARDLEMWGEEVLGEILAGLESRLPGTLGARERKDQLLKELFAWIRARRGEAKHYVGRTAAPVRRTPQQKVCSDNEDNIFGACPVFSDKTVCCGLKTLDAVKNCGFACSYCTVQTFYGDKVVFDGRLGSKLSALSLDPKRFYHIGTGQSSDSLMWGNYGGLLDELLRFAASHPNVLLELKTKSSNVEYLLKAAVPSNIVCSWSLNTDTIITHEEHLTAPLTARLRAARMAADRGIRVALHFHPLVYYHGWEEEYRDLAREVQSLFKAQEIAFISFGSVTFIKPVVRALRRRGEPSRILQMEFVTDPHGKLTYPDEIKEKLFSNIFGAFSSWHGKVYFYLCMEKASLWEKIFGRCYADNNEFSADFAAHCGWPRELKLSYPRQAEPG
ncbi:MAG: DNA photolyase [Deltaproteobacteria bacterium]|nr:DNA photolyase [Deltaproteobacteria bacterium]